MSHESQYYYMAQKAITLGKLSFNEYLHWINLPTDKTSTKDAITTALHYTLTHLEKKDS